MSTTGVARTGPGQGHRRRVPSSPLVTLRCRRCDEVIVDASAYQFAGGAWEHLVCPEDHDPRDESEDLD